MIVIFFDDKKKAKIVRIIWIKFKAHIIEENIIYKFEFEIILCGRIIFSIYLITPKIISFFGSKFTAAKLTIWIKKINIQIISAASDVIPYFNNK